MNIFNFSAAAAEAVEKLMALLISLKIKLLSESKNLQISDSYFNNRKNNSKYYLYFTKL